MLGQQENLCLYPCSFHLWVHLINLRNECQKMKIFGKNKNQLLVALNGKERETALWNNKYPIQ